MDYNYISLALGLLLSISEILPFIKRIKGNGIVNVLQSFLIKQSELGHNLLESEPLIEPTARNTSTRNASTSTRNASTYTGITLHTPDQYQLIYIDKCLRQNYITKHIEITDLSDDNFKILKSLGFEIECYNREYVIRW